VRIVDISLPLGPDLPIYPGDPPVVVDRLSEATGGDSFALSRLSLGSHSATHIDPPAHFIAGGATVDAVPLDACIGPAFVLDVTDMPDLISVAALERIPDGMKRILFCTGGPPLGGAALAPETAIALVERHVGLVGIDALSIASAAALGEVHRILLSAGIVILEGLDLTAAPNGPATLVCLPLKIAGGDGAPARAVLLYDE
jgi:arylformamidase